MAKSSSNLGDDPLKNSSQIEYGRYYNLLNVCDGLRLIFVNSTTALLLVGKAMIIIAIRN